MTYLTRTLGVFLAASLSGGCLVLGSGSGSGSADDDDAGDDADDGTDDAGDDGAGDGMVVADDDDALAALASCRGDADDSEVLDSLVITDEYGESLHEMVACGQLSVALCAGVISGIFDAIAAQSDDATPDGWEFVGEGVYRTSSSSTEMQMRFYLAEDFSFGSAGDPVRENLFLVDSYLVNAALSIDWTTGAAELVYDEPGPLVELLGLGVDPPNPLPVDWTDLADLQTKLRALEFEGDIVVLDPREHSTIAYDLHVPRQTADSLVSGTSPMRFQLTNADGDRADLGQTIVMRDFDVAYANHGTLDGSVDFTAQGGPVDYDAYLEWNDTPFPTRTVSCPQ